jgi:hypothetical protein
MYKKFGKLLFSPRINNIPTKHTTGSEDNFMCIMLRDGGNIISLPGKTVRIPAKKSNG